MIPMTRVGDRNCGEFEQALETTINPGRGIFRTAGHLKNCRENVSWITDTASVSLTVVITRTYSRRIPDNPKFSFGIHPDSVMGRWTASLST